MKNFKNIFITGDLRSGKTTIINSVIKQLDIIKIDGFKTSPVFENEKKTGFVFESFSGVKKCFAHIKMNSKDKFDVYQFDYTIFEDFGAIILQNSLLNSDLIIMDEIGVMEKQAKIFINTLVNCLDSKKIVLGVFQKRALWFYDIIKERNDTEIFHINKNNRELLPKQITSFIKNILN